MISGLHNIDAALAPQLDHAWDLGMQNVAALADTGRRLKTALYSQTQHATTPPVKKENFSKTKGRHPINTKFDFINVLLIAAVVALLVNMAISVYLLLINERNRFSRRAAVRGEPARRGLMQLDGSKLFIMLD